MIQGAHAMFYTSEPDALREFLRDKLALPHSDVGGGWLIFDLPEAEVACHPSAEDGEGGSPTGTHDISFYCDDLETTVAELRGRGVEFEGEPVTTEWGKLTHFAMPGGVRVMLYERRYSKASP